MAEAFNVNPNKAYFAGILHDCAKYMSDSELLNICYENVKLSIECIIVFAELLHSRYNEKNYSSNDNCVDFFEWNRTSKNACTESEIKSGANGRFNRSNR